MIGALELFLLSAGLVVALPVLVLLSLVVASLAPYRPAKAPAGRHPRTAVLVPAHNEERIIGRTLAAIRRQLADGDRLVVVADNCTDRTAEIALRHGAEVAVRTDASLRGKGFALDHGLRFLEETGAPEVVIVIDADCLPDEGSIDRLARTAANSMRPVQAAYLMNTPRPARKKGCLVSFAWQVNDFARPLGWYRLGLPCRLAGSGMAFPWDIVRSVNLASGELAEDLKLSVDLALAGRFALFCPEAVVRSDVAPGGTPSPSQRARWEHGVIEASLRSLPPTLSRFFWHPDPRLLAVALDLGIPPLALLALALAVEAILALGLFVVFHVAAPAVISLVTCTVFLSAILLAWWRHGQDIIPLRWLVFAPIYAIGKIPMYGRFFLNRQRAWIGGDRQTPA